MTSARKRASRRNIRSAIDSDIPVIRAWLLAHEKAGISETLAVNWDTTLEVYREKGMLIYECPHSRQAVAYFWGSLHSTSSILEIRHDYRGRGIGRAMVQYLIRQAISAREVLLHIDCAPISSVPFWQRMGFTVLSAGAYESKAVCKLGVPLRLPLDGTEVQVVIRFLTEDALYNGGASLFECSPRAVRAKDGTIRLAERVAHFSPSILGLRGDLAVELWVNGHQLYRGKAKYDKAENLGVFRCRNGFAIDRIVTSKAS